MRILAFDPSLTCTGWAMIETDGTSDGRYIAAGYIQPTKFEQLTDRILDLASAIEARVRRDIPDVIVIETPAATGRARSGQRFAGTALTIPVYGAAVGACIVACGVCRLRSNSIVIVGTASDEWTKARDTPRCSGDADKTNRVEYVRRVWNLPPLGPKSLAGNVADALLIARWQVRRELRWNVND